MTWLDRFDRLLKAMASGEPHKAKSNQQASGTLKPNGEEKAPRD
jgi:hypothetical protein